MKPRIALAYNINDAAGSGAAKRLIDIVGAERSECELAKQCYILRTGHIIAGYDREQVRFDFLDRTPDPKADVIIILSRHASTSGRPTLTTHHTGNPTRDALLGGEPEKLAWSAPPVSSLLLRLYKEEAEKRNLLGKYEISLEATHHGPTENNKPLVFIEIGSTPDEWADEKAQEAMAYAVARALESDIPECRIAAGFGGTHYPRKYTKIHLEGEYCFGHIIPKYAFAKGVPDKVIIEAIKKVWPRSAETVIVEKKSLRGADRRRVERISKELGVAFEKV